MSDINQPLQPTNGTYNLSINQCQSSILHIITHFATVNHLTVLLEVYAKIGAYNIKLKDQDVYCNYTT